VILSGEGNADKERAGARVEHERTELGPGASMRPEHARRAAGGVARVCSGVGRHAHACNCSRSSVGTVGTAVADGTHRTH